MLHDDELAIDETLVRALLAREVPDLAGLPIRRLAASGSSNSLFRWGDELLVRLPRQPGGTATIVKEARWSSYVAGQLGARAGVAVPEVVVIGEPGDGYPEAWSVVRWIDGEPPVARDGGSGVAADDLAGLVSALRAVPVPAHALADPDLRWYRSAPLADCADDGREALLACRDLPDVDLDLDAAAALWESLVTVPQPPRTEATARWVHADLVAENLLVRDGRLTALLDLGGLAVGDPAVDLVSAWELLDAGGRARFREQVGISDDEWLVGAGWALLLAAITLPYYSATMPARCADRLVAARAVVAELG